LCCFGVKIKERDTVKERALKEFEAHFNKSYGDGSQVKLGMTEKTRKQFYVFFDILMGTI
jgi:hypothetical protein